MQPPKNMHDKTRLLSLEFHILEFDLYALQDLGVGFGLHLSGSEPVAFGVRAFGANRLVCGRRREDVLALGALIVRRLRAWHIPRIAVRILVLLGSAWRVSKGSQSLR